MKTHSEPAFLRWAEKRGIVVDPAYPNSAALTFQNQSHESRFWVVPARPERRPGFMLSLLDLMGTWQACFVWRHLGAWPSEANIDALRINDCVEFEILRGLGAPLGSNKIIEFQQNESTRLVMLLFSTSIFGWSVGEDLYVVPSTGRCFLKTDHHGVVHVEFCDMADVELSVSAMAECGFPLPDELPDKTFKQPDWMKTSDS
jgi:hypothetical protein